MYIRDLGSQESGFFFDDTVMRKSILSKRAYYFLKIKFGKEPLRPKDLEGAQSNKAVYLISSCFFGPLRDLVAKNTRCQKEYSKGLEVSRRWRGVFNTGRLNFSRQLHDS